VLLAKKQGRAPQYNSPFVRDELYGFLQAGFDTTSGTVKWGEKSTIQALVHTMPS